MPYYPRQDKKGEIPYTILTRPEKLVMDYCHINIYEVQEMEIDIYLFFLREAMIFENSQTEEGRKYLKDCFRMEQTKPDREGLRERFGNITGHLHGNIILKNNKPDKRYYDVGLDNNNFKFIKWEDILLYFNM